MSGANLHIRGLLLNFKSTCSNAWKSGLITCLLKRAKLICSGYELFKDEITKLRCIFAKNCYPNWFFNKCLKKFENNTKPDSHDKEVDDYAYIPASWLSGNAFVSGAGGLWFKSRAGQIATAATFLRMELCCPGAMTRRWAPPTRYTLRRIAASIMKDLI